MFNLINIFTFMKKIYLLMAMAVFALTSVAANYQLSGMQLAPEAKAQLQKDFESFEAKVLAGDESVITRSYTDPNGNVWQGRFLNYGADWFTMFTYNDGSQATFEDMPWYRVAAICAQYDESGYAVNFYYGYLLYPPHWIFGESSLPLEETEPLAISELETSGYNKFGVQEAGYVGMYDDYTWGIINGEWMGVQSMFRGAYGYMEPGSTLTISNYDETTSSIGMKWQGAYYEEGAATTSGAFALNYDGTAFITGFKPMTFNGDFTQIHMYDFGQVDWDTYPGDLYEVDFEPVRLFKTLAHNDKVEVRYGEETGTPEGFIIADETVTNDQISYLIASAYTALDATTPVGVDFTVQDIIVNDEGYIDNAPLAGTIPPGGYVYDFSQYDGCELYYHGNSYIPEAGSVLSIQENSFQYDGTDIYGNAWKMTFPELYLHLDPSDYTQSEKLTSGINRLFGDKSVNLVTKTANSVNVTVAENGVIAVYSTTGALVKTVNAVAGERVSIELGKGLYIVKVGKTVAKVIL